MWKQCLGASETSPKRSAPSSSELERRGPWPRGEEQRLWEPPLSPSAQTHVGGLPWALAPGWDPRAGVLPMASAGSLETWGASFWGHAVPLPSPATSLQPTWPDSHEIPS